MKRRLVLITAFLTLYLAGLAATPAHALEEADRLWLVGERAFADRLFPVARSTLERLVTRYPADHRLGQAVLLLGKARLALGETEPALEAFRRAQRLQPTPGEPMEARFWEAEALFRLERFGEARVAYDDILRTNAASPLAPDALYGYAWSEIELKRPEPAVTALRDFLTTWPEHALAGSATVQLARGLVELKRLDEALPLLTGFVAQSPGSRLLADAQYLLGWVKVATGDPRGGLADLRAFVAAHPRHGEVPAARRLIAQTVGRYGDREELLDAYKTLMEDERPTAETLYDAASIASRLGRARDQDNAWKKLRAGFPEHALTRRLAVDMASTAFTQKQWKDAVALAAVAAQSEEGAIRAEAWLLAGESELKLRRFAAAARAFEAVGAVDEAEAGVRYRALAGLGLAHEEQQDWRAALAAYEAVADRSPDTALQEWARERVTAMKSRLAPRPAPKSAAPRTSPSRSAPPPQKKAGQPS